MSLVGNLEDLGLGDILQIVSLSRKSGILFLNTPDKEGKLVFKDGQVIRAFSTDINEDLAGVLVERGLLGADQASETVRLYEEGGRREKLDNILTEKFGIEQDKIDEFKKGCIEKSAYSLFGWISGNFNFELKDVDEYLTDADFFVYEHGMNPQFIAMEGTRLQDELRRDGAAAGAAAPAPEPVPEAAPAVEAPPPVEPSFAEEVFPEEPVEEVLPEISGEEIKALHEETVPEEPKETVPSVKEEISLDNINKGVVIIDDDPNTLNVIRDGLSSRGYDAIVQEKTESALHVISELRSTDGAVVVLADLIMPRMDGTGILGGIETLEILRGGFPDIPVILMTDHVNRDAEKRADEMGAHSYIDKPKRAQFGTEYDHGAVESFLDKVASILEPAFSGELKKEEGGIPAEASGLVDLAVGLEKEFAAVGEILPEDEGPAQPPSSPGISILKSMIEELNGPEGGKQITLLTLRFASELMNRSVIFLAKSDGFEGLGQFGIELKGEIAEKRVRSMKISKDIPSILKDVTESQRSITKKLEDTEGNRYIIDNLGGHYPFESYAAPIIANDKVAVILYCDNVPEDKEIGDASALDVFLMQAGVAMERALLERRVSEMSHA
ncbi:MAG: response regulator [Deltaproteobacteria bacterium]|nr:response regulator [Deltaproteobacteria bacterium]